MPSLLGLFWLLRTAKFIFLYLYLWQLKEYHTGRFFDHFQTEKGKRLLLNPLYFLKVILLILFFVFLYFSSYFPAYFNILFNVYSLFPSFLLILYFAESLRVLNDLFRKRLKFPTFTKKTIFLSLILLSTEALFIFFLFTYEKDINFFAVSLLAADIFIPFLASCLILLFQPLTVFFRNINIRKAKKKRKGLKNLLVIGVTGSYGKTSTKEDVVNRDLWEKLVEAVGHKVIDWKLIKGHAGHPGNERCDIIATSFADKNPVVLYNGSRSRYGIDISISALPSAKKAKSKSKAYSYVSLVDGVIQVHKTWEECKARVHGVNAKFKKSVSPQDEEEIIREFTE